jgi:hypothetical protein
MTDTVYEKSCRVRSKKPPLTTSRKGIPAEDPELMFRAAIPSVEAHPNSVEETALRRAPHVVIPSPDE